MLQFVQIVCGALFLGIGKGRRHKNFPEGIPAPEVASTLEENSRRNAPCLTPSNPCQLLPRRYKFLKPGSENPKKGLIVLQDLTGTALETE